MASAEASDVIGFAAKCLATADLSHKAIALCQRSQESHLQPTIVQLSLLSGSLTTISPLVRAEKLDAQRLALLAYGSRVLVIYERFLETIVVALEASSITNCLRLQTCRIDKTRVDDLGIRFREVEAVLKNLASSLADSNFRSEEMLGKLDSQVRQLELHFSGTRPNLLTGCSRDEETQQFLSWLSPLNFEDRHKNLLSIRTKGSGTWLVGHELFKKWEHEDQNILWCPGIPGSGKTFATSGVIEYLRQQQSQLGKQGRVIFAYCSYYEQHSQSARNLIGSLLGQLVVMSPVILPKLQELFQACSRGRTRPSFATLVDMFKEELRSQGPTFIIIDALDECVAGNGSRLELLTTLKQTLSFAKIFITSRFIGDVEATFGEILRLEITPQDGDLQDYILYRIQRSEKLTRFLTDDLVLQESVLATLKTKSDGVFLLVRLWLDQLETSRTKKAFMQDFVSLPKDLDFTYTAMLERIFSQATDTVDLAKDILSIVISAVRPLTLWELQCALALDPEDDFLDRNDIIDADILYKSCLGLVRVDESKMPLSRVGLIHYSAREFIKRRADVTLPRAEIDLFLRCMNCLTITPYTDGACLDDGSLRIRLEENPFYEYSAMHWWRHLRNFYSKSCGSLTEANDLRAKVMDFLNNPGALASAIQVQHLPKVRSSQWSQRYPRGVTPLLLASFLGLTDICRQCLELHPESIKDEETTYYGTAIQAAALGGHSDTLEFLFSKFEDQSLIDSHSGKYGTALQAAAYRGSVPVVTTLLRLGAGVNVRCGEYETPLKAATVAGHTEIVRLLLEHGADPNDHGQGHKHVMHEACIAGRPLIVNLLLEHGASVLTKDSETGRTPLAWAAFCGHDQVVSLLLRQKLHIDATDYQQSTALHLAIEKHHRGIANLLLDRGARLDIANHSRQTQAQMAFDTAQEGSIDPANFSTIAELDHGRQADHVLVKKRKADAMHVSEPTRLSLQVRC